MRNSLATARNWLVAIVVMSLVPAIVGLGMIVAARAQSNHDLHHDHYRNWVNKNGQGCCDNTDCGQLADDAIRTTDGKLEVRVNGVGPAKGQSAWCPVMAHHYLSAGNAPNGSVNHACVSAHYGGQTPCEQFICFQPPAGI